LPQILPLLHPRPFPHGAFLLGAHVEGPYLSPAKKGAHNASFFATPEDTSPSSLYGESNLRESIKMLTLAPEHPGTIALIGSLREEHPHIAISMGHSSATFSDGELAVNMGARMLTHVFNAMPPLHHRDPGLAGLIATGKVWYSVIPDGIHLHPSILTIALRANPDKCILITDSIELAGLPDGVHKGHGQIGGLQRKTGNKVVLDGTDTLVGSCIKLDECVRNMVQFTGCTLAEAVRCVTENVADMMDEGKRGHLEPGRRADFVVLSERGVVRETWVEGRRVWNCGDEEGVE
jgi:N-acetylglucosamine-6-phosphate deacetylase